MMNEKAPVNEVRFPAYEAENPQLDSYLYVKDSALRKTFDEFMTGKGSTNPRRVTATSAARASSTAGTPSAGVRCFSNNSAGGASSASE